MDIRQLASFLMKRWRRSRHKEKNSRSGQAGRNGSLKSTLIDYLAAGSYTDRSGKGKDTKQHESKNTQ